MDNSKNDAGFNYDSTQDTLLHIKRVNELLIGAAIRLMQRATVHDDSKLVSPEKQGFDKASILKELKYGSEEYHNSLAELQTTLTHHYNENSHHPQHYLGGIDGMNLFDIIEMFFDWKAATERTFGGNILESIEINKDRFNMSDQLTKIFINTCDLLTMNKKETDNFWKHDKR